MINLPTQPYPGSVSPPLHPPFSQFLASVTSLRDPAPTNIYPYYKHLAILGGPGGVLDPDAKGGLIPGGVQVGGSRVQLTLLTLTAGSAWNDTARRLGGG